MKILGLASLALLFSGCASLMKPQPIPLVHRQKVEAQIKEYRKKGVSTIVASHGNSIRELKAGQWVAEVTEDLNGTQNITLRIWRIIKADKRGVEMETESYTAVGEGIRNLIYQKIENYPQRYPLTFSEEQQKNAFENMKVKETYLQVGDQPTNNMGLMSMLSENAGIYILKSIKPSEEPKSQACESSYIKSQRCVVMPFTISTFGMSTNGKILAHSEIPILGRIKLETKDIRSQVIAFGWTGAKSKIKLP